MIPTSLRNQIDADVRACIIEEGNDPERCIIQTAKRYGLSKDEAEEIAEEMADYD